MFSNFRMRPFGEFPLSQDDSNMDLAQEGMLLWGGGGAALPVNSVLPIISGTVQVGQTLTTTDGTTKSITRCPMCGYKTSTAARKVPRFADVFRLIWRV